MTLKKIWAIIAGLLIVAVLSVLTDAVMEKLGVFPGQAHPEAYTQWMWALALGYRVIYTILGGYVTAKLAPTRPMAYAITLGIIGIVLASLGAVANWSKSSNGEWYPIMLIITSLPSTWLGGKLFVKLNHGQQ